MSISFRAMTLLRYFAWIRSDGLDAGLGDDVAPFRYFLLDALPHAVRSVGQHLKAVIAQLLRNLRRLQNSERVGRQQLDDGGRRSRRREKSLKSIGDEILLSDC